MSRPSLSFSSSDSVDSASSHSQPAIHSHTVSVSSGAEFAPLLHSFSPSDESSPDSPHSSSSFSFARFFSRLFRSSPVSPSLSVPRSVHFRPYHSPHVDPSGFSFPPNSICNQKYTLLTFVPRFLYEEFRFFFNLYFLLVALSQFITVLKVGFLFTYIAPLVFVLTISMIKEGLDDLNRYRRDLEANSARYSIIKLRGNEVEHVNVTASAIRVGDLIELHSNQRVPADCLLLRIPVQDSSASDRGDADSASVIYIRTDQMDGETDLKPRLACHSTQSLPDSESLLTRFSGIINAEPPRKHIYSFNGNCAIGDSVEPLTLEHTLWANCVLASGPVVALVLYTGSDTRSVLNAANPRSKIGTLDLELNLFSKILFGLTVLLAFILTALKGFVGLWPIYFFRFLLLFASIIPISMRVNLDMGKTVYSWLIERDSRIDGTIVRNSNLPEELGRIKYLFTDKTGTLTKNIMTLKTIQMAPPLQFNAKNTKFVRQAVALAFGAGRIPPPVVSAHSPVLAPSLTDRSKGRKPAEFELTQMSGSRSRSPPPSEGSDEDLSLLDCSTLSAADLALTRRLFLCLALCHNVTPVLDETGENYQAASPDEIALVSFCSTSGLRLVDRSSSRLVIETPQRQRLEYEILSIFPFSSDTKRMGIIVKEPGGSIVFYLKGAESVMKARIKSAEWLSEEIDNLSRIGLRTLVFAWKGLSGPEYAEWRQRYDAARASLIDRELKVQQALAGIETALELLGVTGVEDKLQDGVRNSLETLRNANIKLVMLTGDQQQTAICIGISCGLIEKNQPIFAFQGGSQREILRQLDSYGVKAASTALVIDGATLQVCLDQFESQFVECLCAAPAVICCRCSPQQKADIVKLVKRYSGGATVAAIGDGGNDTNMITQADVGLGIVGKEGMQASLAADYSLTQFSHCCRLILWHGRNSYQRSARLSQFVIHRGIIISIVQAVFSALFFYATIPIFSGWLVVGYATAYTMLPVFALVLDEDVDSEKVFLYPELYKELQRGRPLSFKTFSLWLFQSIYQGGCIMMLAIVLFESNFLHIVSIAFTSLIACELLNVALEVHRWHRLMVAAQLASVAIYLVSLIALKSYFDISFILTFSFFWKVTVITLIASMPPAAAKWIQVKCNPQAHTKVNE